jgi:hypothetical protein
MHFCYKMMIAGCLSIGLIGPAPAQETAFLGGKTIKLVVPFAAGGAQDVIARLMAERLSPRLGNTIIIENKGGAAGIPAAESVARAEPDGATLLMATGGAITIAPNRPHGFRFSRAAGRHADGHRSLHAEPIRNVGGLDRRSPASSWRGHLCFDGRRDRIQSDR